MTNPAKGSDLPAGTVTFLFTDIENSTPLWAEGRSMTMDEAIDLAVSE